MQDTLVVRGRYVDGAFIPDEPMPKVQGSAELIIRPLLLNTSGSSIADAFGAATLLRGGQDILAQVRAERDQWGDH